MTTIQTTTCPAWCTNTAPDGVHGDDHFTFVLEGFAGRDLRLLGVYLRQPQDLGELHITVGVDLPIAAELMPSQARSLAAGLLRAADLAEGLCR